MIEQELVVRAQKGDPAAFTGLVEQFQTGVFNLCYRMLGEASQAEDAAQETFIRAYYKLPNYDPARPFRTWLYAIACHYCIDQIRKRRGSWLEWDDEVQDTIQWRSPAPGPEELALLREQNAALQSLLNRLEPVDRTVILLRYWYDFSNQEIAEANGTTVKAVKSRMHRARRRLAEMLVPAVREQVVQVPAARWTEGVAG